MTNLDDGILLDAEHYVESFLKEFLPKSRCFHNLRHTRGVVEACEKIAEAHQMPWHESETLYLAAWFHDIGYCNGRTDHEEQSIIIAGMFLEDYTLPEGFYHNFNNLIRSTRPAYQPKTLAEKIIRDADLYHLSSPKYEMFAQLLKQELEWADGIKYSDQEWVHSNIRFLEEHRYQSEYAVRSWETQKQLNLLAQKKLIRE